MSNIPLAQHALLSDCGASALVTSAGSVDWLCLPRFDHPSVFARLLDDAGGHFSIRPADPAAHASWSYRPASLVLETTWKGPSGALVVTDTLALGKRERGHDLGRSSPGVLLRGLRCIEGEMRVEVEFVPRPEYGLVHPRLTQIDDVLVADGGSTVLMLSTATELTVRDGIATGSVRLQAGQEVGFALEQADAWVTRPRAWKPRKVRRRLRDTEDAWQSWSRLHQNYEGPMRELVQHSGVVLQGLTDARSGSIVAAPTTSLPEGIGSERTWDYRFTWVRDASMTMQGLYTAACPDEGGRFFDFLSRAAAAQLDEGLHAQIMFGMRGERDLTERKLPHLEGWRGSGPVRVGNDAWKQHQLDVYGAMLDAAHTLRDQLGQVDQATRRFLVAAVDAAATRWREDDQGIWEFRGEPRAFLYSKLMCWVALDRGLAMTEQLQVPTVKKQSWAVARNDIRDAIERLGWNEDVGAYTQSFGSSNLDASALMMAIVGYLPPDDERLLATIDVIADGLTDQSGLLYRYNGDDGLPGAEGTFLLCTFWLAHALALTNQVERSRQVLERATATANDLGLMAEQVDQDSGELLGNYPQAFSHLGLINAAQALADAEQRQRRRADP